MLIRTLLPILLTLCTLPVLAQAPESDQKAVDLLRQVLNTSGATLHPFSTFKAEGTITYYWDGQPVAGSATIRARGGDQFRLDANLPDGIRSFSISHRGGTRKGLDGKLTAIPAHNTVGAGVLTLPYPSIAAQLADSGFTISYVGLINEVGGPAHQVRVERNIAKDADPDGMLAALYRTDYFIDAQSLLVIRVEDTTHPVESMTETYPHAIELEDYALQGGIAVPGLVREKVAGQTTWELRVSTISFNPNLQDGDFSLQ